MLTRPGRLPDRHPPLPSGQSLNPAATSHHARLSFTGHQQGFTHVHPSGLPLARAPGVEPVALRLSPELRTPPSPAAHVRGGDRPSSTDLELPLNSHPSISNPVVHSMRATSRRTATSRCVATRRSRPAFVLARAWEAGRAFVTACVRLQVSALAVLHAGPSCPFPWEATLWRGAPTSVFRAEQPSSLACAQELGGETRAARR